MDSVPRRFFVAVNAGFALALIVAIADWVAVARANRALVRVLKPATLLAIIGATYLLTLEPHDAWQARWFLLGLVCSLAGDVFLLYDGTRPFLLGLVSFLAAHILYIIGLNPTLPPPQAYWLLIPCFAFGVAAAVAPVRALRAKRQTALIPPALVYGLAITLMLFSAWATLYRPDWSTPRQLLVILGATLFFISDSLLARNRFVGAFPYAALAVIITYHLGQMALAASISLVVE